MNEPGQNPPLESNPYAPPFEAGPPPISYAMPPLHWPRTIGVSLILFVIGWPTYGFTVPFAVAILLGGIRTALIYRGCEKRGLLPPSYIGSTIVSPIVCLIFQIAAGVAFFFVCASIFAFDVKPVSEQTWLTMTGIIAFAVFAILYAGSIKIAISSSRPIQQASSHDR